MSSTTATTNKCNLCGKDATKLCSRCKTVYYCSVECQKQNWKLHKPVCNDAFQADQYTLHKKSFDQIVKKYGLDSEEKSSAIADFLTGSSGDSKAVSPADFAEKFGMPVEEAVVFLEWIKVGVKFKQESAEAAKKSGIGAR